MERNSSTTPAFWPPAPSRPLSQLAEHKTLGSRYLRSRRDARALRQAAASSRSSVVIGSGFIGCEAAASLVRRGLVVTLVTMEELPQIDRLGRGAGERLRSWLQNEGVTLRLGVEVAEVQGNRLVHLSDGTTAEGDFILVAGGVKPEAALAADGGLDMAQDRVTVDTHMRSSHPDVLAAGDVAFAYNTGAERHLAVEHWGEALTMGRVAGATAAGHQTEWSDVPGFWSTIGDRTLKYAAWGDGLMAITSWTTATEPLPSGTNATASRSAC